jgi:AcrR family transcriptional regulator
MMDGYERRKQKKLDQIYAAAFQLIIKYGFSKVSVNEIAQKARVSPATIYNYFGAKEQLYTKMLEYWLDKQLVEYERILYSRLSFPEKIKEIMLSEARNLKALSEGMNQTFDVETDAMEMLKSSEDKLSSFYLKLIAIGKQEGYIQTMYTAESIQRYFKMFMNEVSRCLQHETQDTADSQIDQLLHMFFYGLIKPENS